MLIPRKHIMLRLEYLLHKMGDPSAEEHSMEDNFDMLDVLVSLMLHDLESTKRENEFLRGLNG